MVQCLYFNRDDTTTTTTGMQPVVNTTYYCPTFFSASTHADILPKEEVMIMIPKSDRRLAKYVEFLDSMIFQPDKKMTLKVINQHATEKVQVFKGMPLTTLLSNPFIKSEFCTVKSILSRPSAWPVETIV
jgi:hypothetical protein